MACGKRILKKPSDNNQDGNERKENVKDEPCSYEKLNQTCNLDYEITEKEILAACQKLKNNKLLLIGQRYHGRYQRRGFSQIVLEQPQN